MNSIIVDLHLEKKIFYQYYHASMKSSEEFHIDGSIPPDIWCDFHTIHNFYEMRFNPLEVRL